MPTIARDPSKEFDAAVAAVRAAAAVCRNVQQKLVTADAALKKDKSPVTVADYASQALICAALSRALPRDAVVAEEGTAELREPAQEAIRREVVERVSEVNKRAVPEKQVLDWIDRGAAGTGKEKRFWTVDPIDGTKGFLRKEQYAVALALIEDGRVIMGILGCPNLALGEDATPGVLLVARRSGGTRVLPLWEGDSRNAWTARVTHTRDAAQARFCESVESGHSDQDASAKIAAKLGITAEPLRMDSQAKYATVAAAQASIYLRLPTRADYREKIWDHAAGMIVVEEAGGRVTDITGKPLDFTHGRELAANKGVVATNGPIHDAVLAAVQDSMK